MPVWELAGLDQATFRDLDWEKKREVIVRYCGQPIRQITPLSVWACPKCGFRIDHISYALCVSFGCPKDRIPYRKFVRVGERSEADVFECAFVADAYPHKLPDTKRGASLTWWTLPN